MISSSSLPVSVNANGSVLRSADVPRLGIRGSWSRTSALKKAPGTHKRNSSAIAELEACSWTLATSSETQVTTSSASRPSCHPSNTDATTWRARPAARGSAISRNWRYSAPLNEATPADDKQRTVILGDLAAVEAAQRNPGAACAYAEQALHQLAITWYATGMDRILDVRKTL